MLEYLSKTYTARRLLPSRPKVLPTGRAEITTCWFILTWNYTSGPGPPVSCGTVLRFVYYRSLDPQAAPPTHLTSDMGVYFKHLQLYGKRSRGRPSPCPFASTHPLETDFKLLSGAITVGGWQRPQEPPIHTLGWPPPSVILELTHFSRQWFLPANCRRCKSWRTSKIRHPAGCWDVISGPGGRAVDGGGVGGAPGIWVTSSIRLVWHGWNLINWRAGKSRHLIPRQLDRYRIGFLLPAEIFRWYALKVAGKCIMVQNRWECHCHWIRTWKLTLKSLVGRINQVKRAKSKRNRPRVCKFGQM